jgi:hypothetical protein
MTIQNFDDTRPYNNEEIPDALRRVANHFYFPIIIHYIFPEEDINAYKENFLQIKSSFEFQKKVMYKAVKTLIGNSTTHLTSEGIEYLRNDKNYMFIANHRDILLDSAILEILLIDNQMDSSEITFGSNLMKDDFIIDVGKINKMFKIVRDGNLREAYNNSMKVSQYMRYAITEKKQSTWIAQRSGRTKDGNDMTEVAVLKMFVMSSKKTFVDNLVELNITPLVISYEYEPCDFFKTREIYISRRENYRKAQDEDLQSILYGIKQWKGNIHFAFTQTITEEELVFCSQHPDKFKLLTDIIDKRIYTHYKLWPTNYIAYDLVANTTKFNSLYSLKEKEEFVRYMCEGLKCIDGNIDELKDIFLKIYANPVSNYLKSISVSDTKNLY